VSNPETPSHWVICPTSDVAALVRGVTYGKQDARKSEAKGLKPILRANNINGTINFDDLVFLPAKLISPMQHLRAGDILFAMSSGSRHLVGKSARIGKITLKRYTTNSPGRNPAPPIRLSGGRIFVREKNVSY